MLNKILILCLGNICRSPMAEALLQYNKPDIQVNSAGIIAIPGSHSDQNVQKIMLTQGLDLSAHRAKQLTSQMLIEHELILVMDRKQEKQIILTAPHTCGKVHRLGKWGDFDIPDPYCRSLQILDLVLELIKHGLSQWKTKLWP